MPAQPIRKRKLYEDVADQLERMIRDGQFADTAQLPSERELMREFGVGRPAVREALFHLRKMGLVEVRSGERARITRPTAEFVIGALSGTARLMLEAPGGIHHFQDARMFLEVGLARHAARHASASELGDLEAALATNHASIGDLRRFERTDVAFHYVFAVIAGNPIFTAIHAALVEWLIEQRRTTLAPGEDVVAYEAHRTIFEAVKSRDPDRAEAAMRAHLDHVARRYSEITEARP